MTWIRNTNATIKDSKVIIFCEDAFHRDLLEGEYKKYNFKYRTENY